MRDHQIHGYTEPPYCNQAGKDRIRELNDKVKAQQRELEAAREAVSELREVRAMIEGMKIADGHYSGYMSDKDTDPIDEVLAAYDAARAGQGG